MDKAIEFDSLRQLLENARAIKQMPAFQRWEQVVKAQIDGRARMALNPIKSVDEAMERNYMNGEGAGLMNAVGHWDLMIETLETEVQRMLEDMDNED
jgi:hypothetical protein